MNSLKKQENYSILTISIGAEKAEWYSQVEENEEKAKFKWGKDPSSERAHKEITAKLSHFHSLK